MELHFDQASNTLLGKERFEHLLDNTSDLIQDLYNGNNRDIPWLPFGLNEWLSALKRSDNISQDAVTFDYPFENFVRACETCQESKSSSPSLHHYGHYRALSQEPELLEPIHKLIHLNMKNKTYPSRWVTVHQKQIGKKYYPISTLTTLYIR